MSESKDPAIEQSQVGFDLAQEYLDRSTLLRKTLDIPREAHLQPRGLAQGEHNSNFWFTHPETGEKFVLRINYASQLGLEKQSEYEFNALRALQPSGRVPRPILCDETREVIDRGVLVESFCEGCELAYEDPTDLDTAAAIIADIHAVSTPADSGIITPPDPLLDQFRECEGYFAAYASSSYCDPEVARFVEGLMTQASDAIAQAQRNQPYPIDRSHILNTEAVRMHFLVDHADDGPHPRDRGGYMVDWEKPILGEVSQDIAYFLSPTSTIWDTEFVFDEETRQRFVTRYWECVDGRFPRGDFEERFPLYVMTNCLRGITWSMNAIVEYHDPTRPLQNERTRKKLEEYVDPRFLQYVATQFFGR